MKYLLIILLASISISIAQDKTITIIKVKANTKDNGKITIYKEILDECITNIPEIDNIQADYISETKFVKGINYDHNEDKLLIKDFVKIYTATVEVNYMLRQTQVLIVSTKSIKGNPPEFKKMYKKQKRTKRFKSRHQNGNTYGGRSKRFYFHNKYEDAQKDARRQAKIWLSSQKAVMCDNNITLTRK